jgi:hypothetical protein
MNELTQTTVVSMTTGKRHDNVMRDTRNMLTELYGEGGHPLWGTVSTYPLSVLREVFDDPT